MYVHVHDGFISDYIESSQFLSVPNSWATFCAYETTVRYEIWRTDESQDYVRAGKARDEHGRVAKRAHNSREPAILWSRCRLTTNALPPTVFDSLAPEHRSLAACLANASRAHDAECRYLRLDRGIS